MSSPTQLNPNSSDIVITFTTCNRCGSTTDYCHCANDNIDSPRRQSPFSDDAVLVPTLDSHVGEGRTLFPTPEPGRLSPDSTHTTRIELGDATEIREVSMDEGDERVEERSNTGSPPSYGQAETIFPDCNCGADGGEYCHCAERCTCGQESRVSLSEPSEPASLTKSSAWDVETPCAPVNATHSQSFSAAPMTWRELTERMAEVKLHSRVVPVTKKPLRFKTKEGQTTQRPKRRRWRYAPLNEVLGEDKRRAEEGERALLQHDAPLTRSQLRAYRKSSGSTYPRATSPLRSCITDAK
jgi:hypothetical protein